MSYLIGCCPRNNEGQETYYSNGQYVCGYCGATEEDDGENPTEFTLDGALFESHPHENNKYGNL